MLLWLSAKTQNINKDKVRINFMARIAGVDIPRDKKLPFSLSYIYGIGLTKAKFICDKAKLSQDIRVKDLTDKQVVTIRNVISELDLLIEGEGRTQVSMNIKRLVDLASYRGSRHKKKLPVRGQRTHSNARTRKGKAIAIAGKKLTPLKK